VKYPALLEALDAALSDISGLPLPLDEIRSADYRKRPSVPISDYTPVRELCGDEVLPTQFGKAADLQVRSLMRASNTDHRSQALVDAVHQMRGHRSNSSYGQTL
jgi:hypothetical protein